MKKYLLPLIIFYSCNNRSSQKDNSAIPADSTKTEVSKGDNPILRRMTSADYVVTASYYSPFEMESDEKADKSQEFNIVEKGKLNRSMVQEQNRLSSVTLNELSEILAAPAEEDSIKMMCFEPRNGIFLYKNGEILSYIDICFECYNFSSQGDWGTDIMIDRSKYIKLKSFYKKLGFKYGLDR